MERVIRGPEQLATIAIEARPPGRRLRPLRRQARRRRRRRGHGRRVHPRARRARGPARVPAPDRTHLEVGRRCDRSSTTAGPRRSRPTGWASTASASSRGPTSSRPGGATSPRSSRPASTPTSTAKRARSSRSSTRSGRPRRDRAALETWIERLRGGLDRKAAESLDRLVTIGAARRRPDARDGVRRDVTGMGRPTARAELGVVRAVPAVRVARPDASRARSPT